MIEAQLSKQNRWKTIVRLDANVIEYFLATSTDSATRIHVSHIKSIAL